MHETLLRVLFPTAVALALAATSGASANPCAIPDDDAGALASVDLSQDGAFSNANVDGDDSGIGGTGIRGDDSGIGGTGIRGDGSALAGRSARGDDIGIGGTGLADESGIGGTGVFGTITALGSMCVNGLRVHYSADTEVSVNGRETDASVLAVGQVVWSIAMNREGRLETDRITVHSAVTGRIEAVDAAKRRLHVAGREVLVPDDSRTIVIGPTRRLGFGSLATGQNVDVSGLTDAGGVVVASRVVVVDEVPPSSGARVRIADLVAAASGVERLSIEGYVDRPMRADRVLVGGLAIDLSGRAEQTGRIDHGTRIRATGRLAPDGSLRVEHPRARPPGPPVRQPNVSQPPAEPPERSDKAPVVKPVTRVEPALPPTTNKPPKPPEKPHVPRIDRPEVPSVRKVDRPDRSTTPRVDSFKASGG